MIGVHGRGFYSRGVVVVVAVVVGGCLISMIVGGGKRFDKVIVGTEGWGCGISMVLSG